MLLACWTCFAAGQQVNVHRDSTFQETIYSTEAGSCRISWTVYETEINRGVIRHRSTCTLPLADQAPLIAKVLHKVKESGAAFRTLSWGRLSPDGPRDDTMAARLALAAQ